MEKQQQTAITNIKILCAQNPNHYEWINTDSINLRFLTKKQLVAGGYLNTIPFFIGRTLWNGTVVVGKVYMLHDDVNSFAFNANGEAYYVKENYQVLSYNPRLTVNSACKQIKIEFRGRNNVYNNYIN